MCAYVFHDSCLLGNRNEHTGTESQKACHLWGQDVIKPHALGITKQRAATGLPILVAAVQQQYDDSSSSSPTAVVQQHPRVTLWYL